MPFGCAAKQEGDQPECSSARFREIERAAAVAKGGAGQAGGGLRQKAAQLNSQVMKWRSTMEAETGEASALPPRRCASLSPRFSGGATRMRRSRCKWGLLNLHLSTKLRAVIRYIVLLSQILEMLFRFWGETWSGPSLPRPGCIASVCARPQLLVGFSVGVPVLGRQRPPRPHSPPSRWMGPIGTPSGAAYAT